MPGGFGDRGTQGKIEAIAHARREKVPFLGICLGMQLAVVEFARNELGMPDATSNPNPDPDPDPNPNPNPNPNQARSCSSIVLLCRMRCFQRAASGTCA